MYRGGGRLQINSAKHGLTARGGGGGQGGRRQRAGGRGRARDDEGEGVSGEDRSRGDGQGGIRDERQAKEVLGLCTRGGGGKGGGVRSIKGDGEISHSEL